MHLTTPTSAISQNFLFVSPGSKADERYATNLRRARTAVHPCWGLAHLANRHEPKWLLDEVSRYDTQDFDGLVQVGETVRLWMHGRLDRDFAAILSTTPSRYRATVVTADGLQLIIEGPLDPPWPTA